MANTFYENPFIERNKHIIVEFDKIFNDPELKCYNSFVMSVGKKRVYASYAPTMCKDINKILALNPENAQKVLFSYFNIKKAIDSKLFFTKYDAEKEANRYGSEADRDFGKYKTFIDFLVTTLYTPRFVEIIKQYVEDNYINAVDEEKSVNYASGTTFTNEHFKIFYVTSIMTKFAIPLCTHYIFVNSEVNIDVFRFMYTVFDALFKISVIGTNCTNLLNKLYQYVDRLVRRTESSNKMIWANFPMFNDTRESIIEDLIVKIITTILPKFDLNQSIISLITVVSRESIGKYKIRANNPFDCYRINDNDTSVDEEDRLSENDIFDMFYRTTDESVLILHKYANDDAVNMIQKRSNVNFSREEYEWYLKNYNLHAFTVNIISLVFARFFSGVDNVKSCNFQQFIRLMLILVYKMQNLGINHLPHFVLATRESYSYTKMPSTSILKALKIDPDYNQLIDLKYHNVRSAFEIQSINAYEDKNPIKDMIIGLIHNNYLYNEYKFDKNGSMVMINELDIVNDVIQTFKKMII